MNNNAIFTVLAIIHSANDWYVTPAGHDKCICGANRIVHLRLLKNQSVEI